MTPDEIQLMRDQLYDVRYAILKRKAGDFEARTLSIVMEQLDNARTIRTGELNANNRETGH